jgi:hypothetical protein
MHRARVIAMLASVLISGLGLPPVGLGTGVLEPRTLLSDRPQYFNLDRRIRVESARIELVPGRPARLSFEAAAMIRARFPGRNAPWVVVGFLDREGRVIGGFQQVIEASVRSCGGYERHSVELRGVPASLLAEAHSFTIRMPGGARPDRC